MKEVLTIFEAAVDEILAVIVDSAKVQDVF